MDSEAGTTRFSTGLPVTIMENDDHGCDPRKGGLYFNKSLFSPEPIGQIGNSSRRFFHGPGINNWDMALLKDLRLTESKSLQFRGEFFNAFNHAQFNTPNGNFLNTAFGTVTSAGAPRIGQVALKFIF